VKWLIHGPVEQRKKMATLCGAAKFREETSKKADSAVRDRIAAMHNLGNRSFACKRFFALQHCFPRFFPSGGQ
jgi:hypothetical protein